MPLRVHDAHLHPAGHLAPLVPHPDVVIIGQPALRRIVRVQQSFTSGRGSSPSVELMVRSEAGEISASGNCVLPGSG